MFRHVLIHSFGLTHVLVVTVELLWLFLLNILSFNFVPTPNKFMLDWQDSEEAMKSVLLSFLPAAQATQKIWLMCAALIKVVTFVF